MIEATGRDSLARRVTMPQLARLLARMTVNSFARLSRRLRCAAQPLAVRARSVAVSLRSWTLHAIAAFRPLGRMRHLLSVAAAGAILAVTFIVRPDSGPTGAIEPAGRTPKMVEVSLSPEERRLVTPPAAVAKTVAKATAAETAVSPGAAARTRPVRVETRAIQAVLNRYRDAVSTLDVTAIRAVWPNADLSALRKEFTGVLEQNVEFEACRISTAEAKASASCAGVVESGFKAGDRRPRVQRRRWEFALRKSGDGWRIVEVHVQRGA